MIDPTAPEADAAAALADALTWRNFAAAADPDGRFSVEKRRQDAEVHRHIFLCRMVLRRADIRTAARDLHRLTDAYRSETQAALDGTWLPGQGKKHPAPAAPPVRAEEPAPAPSGDVLP